MPHSMTGFATITASQDGWSWTWEIRGVNGRGLDLRPRLPDWIEGLEQEVRAAVPRAVSRGNVTISLKTTRPDDSGAARIDPAALKRMLEQIRVVEASAAAQGIALRPTGAAEILGMRGVLENGSEDQGAAIAPAIRAGLPELLAAFVEMRASEGAALAGILARLLDAVEALVAQAGELAEARRAQAGQALRDNLARVLENSEGADPDRVAQELALIAVKTDVTEELDRLTAHVAAARELLAQEGPVGRKLDFLMQEFNREANTLCSKAQNPALTRVGLDLKTAIDQMREQVQNVE